MTGRRMKLLIVGTLALAVGVGTAIWMSRQGRRAPAPATREVAREVTADSSLTELAQAVRRGDSAGLALLRQRAEAKTDGKLAPMPAAEAESWVEAMRGLRVGFEKFNSEDKTLALAVSKMILDKFGVEPAPQGWYETLQPVHDLVSLALADREVEVCVIGLVEIGQLWSWMPGADLYGDGYSDQRASLAKWKESFYEPAVACLRHENARARAAAVQCLGSLPLDEKAAPAVTLVGDTDASVRLNVLAAFAERRGILSEEAILPLLHDAFPEIANVAAKVLAGRGLNQEQIGLCRLIGHPKPDLRASAIALLKDRTDIDPIVWLLFLSRDPDDSVRLRAVEALAGHVTPEARPRLEEMAAGDPSGPVRAAASKLLPPRTSSTVALPPLPGSRSLAPRAN